MNFAETQLWVTDKSLKSDISVDFTHKRTVDVITCFLRRMLQLGQEMSWNLSKDFICFGKNQIITNIFENKIFLK